MLRDSDLVAHSRVVMEKPFGTDLRSARELNAKLTAIFRLPARLEAPAREVVVVAHVEERLVRVDRPHELRRAAGVAARRRCEDLIVAGSARWDDRFHEIYGFAPDAPRTSGRG